MNDLKQIVNALRETNLFDDFEENQEKGVVFASKANPYADPGYGWAVVVDPGVTEGKTLVGVFNLGRLARPEHTKIFLELNRQILTGCVGLTDNEGLSWHVKLPTEDVGEICSMLPDLMPYAIEMAQQVSELHFRIHLAHTGLSKEEIDAIVARRLADASAAGDAEQPKTTDDDEDEQASDKSKAHASPIML